MDGIIVKKKNAANTTRAELKRMHVERVVQMLRSGEQGELRDTACAGLGIRVRKKTASWSLRGRLRTPQGPDQSIWTIGAVTADDQPAKIRALASEAKSLLANGVDPTEYLNAAMRQLRGLPPKVEAAAPVQDDVPALPSGPRRRPGDPDHVVRPPPGGALWPVARDEWLDEVKRTLSEATWVSYKNFVLSPHIGPRWDDMTLREFVPWDFKQLQTEVVAKRFTTQHKGILTALKACFSWHSRAAASGIDVSPAAGVLAMKPPRPDDAEEELEDEGARVPTRDEMGALAWRLQAVDCLPQVRLSLMLMALSAQRIRTTRLARLADFENLGDGTGVWGIPASRIKAKVPHAVPLGPLGWAVFEAAAQISGDQPLLLPKTRLRRAGDDDKGAIAWKTIGAAMSTALPGITPHALRRAFATLGEQECGNTRLQTALVLHHGNEKSAKAEGAPTVTALRYALHDRRDEKWAPILAWERWLVERMKASAPHGKEWPRFLPRPPSY